MNFLAQTTYDSNGGVISEAPKPGSTRTYNQTGGYPGQQTQQIQKIAGDEREDEMEQNLGQVLYSFLDILKPYLRFQIFSRASRIWHWIWAIPLNRKILKLIELTTKLNKMNCGSLLPMNGQKKY